MKSSSRFPRWPLLGGIGLFAALLAWRTAARVEGARWYGLVYRAAYLLGLKVWDRDVPASALVDLVEGPSKLPPGRALDLGCGTGTETIYLAKHGWDVTGVDMVPRALSIARGRASEAGVSPRFVEGDVTRLQDFGVGNGYTLLVDFGCFHTLPLDVRDAYVASVSGAAAPGSMFLLYGFTRPPRLAPMAASISTDELQRRFGGNGWELVSAEPVSADAIEVRGRRVDEQFELWRYQLRHLAP